jgi:hypothetical protein
LKVIFRIIDPKASPEHGNRETAYVVIVALCMKAVETTIRTVMTLDQDASVGGFDAPSKHTTEPFPIAQFIANLRLLPDLRCYTPFDLLKSVDDIRTEYLIETKEKN